MKQLKGSKKDDLKLLDLSWFFTLQVLLSWQGLWMEEHTQIRNLKRLLVVTMKYCSSDLGSSSRHLFRKCKCGNGDYKSCQWLKIYHFQISKNNKSIYWRCSTIFYYQHHLFWAFCVFNLLFVVIDVSCIFNYFSLFVVIDASCVIKLTICCYWCILCN